MSEDKMTATAPRALIVYHTKTGHTGQAAKDIAKGLQEGDVACTLVAAKKAGSGELDVRDYEIVLVGTPTYGNRRYSSAAKPVDSFIGSLPADSLEGKYCGAFAVMAGMGAQKLIKAIEGQLRNLGGTIVSGGPAVTAGAPLSLWKGPDASETDVEACREYGRLLARKVAG